MNTDTTYEISSNNSDDTEQFGVRLGQRLEGGEVIELVSDLGGGKTTLVRGIAMGAGSTDSVASPTFMLEKQYQCTGFLIRHFDLYRLAGDKAIVAMTLAEAVDGKDVVVVEWAGQAPEALPEERVTIELRRSHGGEDVRQIVCSYPEKYKYLFEEEK